MESILPPTCAGHGARLLRSVAAIVGLAFAAAAAGMTPVWSLDQIYTNADGSVQFAVYTTPERGQQYLAGHTLIAAESVQAEGRTRRAGSAPQTFTFPRDLPGDSANRSFLVATQRFADLQLVQPDYVVPDNFFPLRDGTLSLAGGGPERYGSPPRGGLHALHSLGDQWIADVAEPTNFAGERHVFAGEHWVVDAAKAGISVGETAAAVPLPGWRLVDAYSSPDRSVQFVVFTTATSGLQFLRGQALTIGNTFLDPVAKIYLFPSDLPGDSAGHRVLIATRGFANLGVLNPDYVVPDGFFTPGIRGQAVISMAHAILTLRSPLEWSNTSVATNYAGESYTFGPGITLPPSPPAPPPPPPPPPPTCRKSPWWCNFWHSP